MPVLQFKGKTAIECYHHTVPHHTLEFDVKLSALGKGEKPGLDGNLIIEGDNLIALKALLPTHAGRIKCIYIDPPYNTGNEKWIYNDNVNSPVIKEWLGSVVDHEDLTRHDKWLCMMTPRLKLLQELMQEDGVICVSIDDTEIANLISLMDEIFGEQNKEEIICWRRRHNQPNDKSKAISKVAEFIVVYAKNLEFMKRQKAFHGLPLTGAFGNPDKDTKGDWASKPWKAGSGQSGSRYKIKTPAGKILDEEWLGNEATYKAYLEEGRMYFPKGGDSLPRKKYYKFEREEEGQCAHNFWGHEDFGSNQEASDELSGLGVEFDNPKPVRLISAILQIFSNKDSIILDSFAGSGTTAHAVLKLNEEDGGNRKCILVQIPYETKEQEKDKFNICEKIASERVRRVIDGYIYKTPKGKKEKVAGLGGSFTYGRVGNSLFGEYRDWGKQLPGYEDLAKYIFYTETSRDFDRKLMNEKTGKIGEHHGTNYYLLYTADGQEDRRLDMEWLKGLDKMEKNRNLVVYCEKLWVHRDDLAKFEQETKRTVRPMIVPFHLK